MSAADPTPQGAPGKADVAGAMRAYWDAAATSYGQGGAFNATQLQRAAWLALFARLFSAEERLDVLDVGCGTGFVSLALAELGHRVTGLDISPEMMRVGRAAADDRGMADRLTFVVGDAERPPAKLGRYDAVVSRHVLWTLARPEDAVRAWVGLVRPGGRVLAVDSSWSVDLVDDMAAWGYPPDVTRRLPLLHASDPGATRNVWLRAGLGDVLTEDLTWLDEAIRTGAPPDQEAMCRDLRFYLVEGTVPGDPTGCR